MSVIYLTPSRASKRKTKIKSIQVCFQYQYSTSFYVGLVTPDETTNPRIRFDLTNSTNKPTFMLQSWREKNSCRESLLPINPQKKGEIGSVNISFLQQRNKSEYKLNLCKIKIVSFTTESDWLAQWQSICLRNRRLRVRAPRQSDYLFSRLPFLCTHKIFLIVEGIESILFALREEKENWSVDFIAISHYSPRKQPMHHLDVTKIYICLLQIWHFSFLHVHSLILLQGGDFWS